MSTPLILPDAGSAEPGIAEPDPTVDGPTVDAPAKLTVVAWHDPVIDVRGYDPRSAYVERFWLGVLGPSTVWLLRRFKRGLDEHPAGFRVDLADTARALGLGAGTGKNSLVVRTVDRACQFGMARQEGPDRIAVRITIPPLAQRQLRRLPVSVQLAHERWIEAPSADDERGRVLALCLADLGHDVDAVETQLGDWRIDPAAAARAARWAASRYSAASSLSSIGAAD